ncbi:leukocyte tyrosine kinase receptor-like isoform X2 [Argiope bruennichi]|uniref:leukocyte tyrosine kinase receptor-like isoform X2 n=1 Tax=Argiope bruennichi TaxID=94029 RepID=UPI002494C4F8|nr:leukocyte tyrosine kinase receptor-like isoform X2 [Argiope bruennichi]
MLLSDMMGPGWSFWVGTVLLLAAGSVFGFDCEFPNRECGWNWSEAWTLLSAANISALGPTAPQADSENNVKGEMLYYSAEVSGPQSLLKVVSPVFEPHTLPTCALQFALHMFRMDFAKFKMIINAPNNSWESTTFEGNSAHRWENQTQPINVVTQPFQVILEILNPGTTYPSHVAIDDIRAINCYHKRKIETDCTPRQFQCDDLICVDAAQVCDLTADCIDGEDEEQDCDKIPESAYCTFEKDMCGWNVSTTEHSEWIRRSGLSPNARTGPSFDHTFQNSTGTYLVAKFPPGRSFGVQTTLISPWFMPPPYYHRNIHSAYYNSCQVRFFFHKFGSGVGELRVYSLESDAAPHGPKFTELWRSYGNKGDTWWKAIVNLPNMTKPFQVHFVAGRGVGNSDIAIDDITLSPECFGIGVPENESIVPDEPSKQEVPTSTAEKHEKQVKKFMFTTCGAIGRLGPNEEQCNAAYQNSTTKVYVMTDPTLEGIQKWEVPQSGLYTVFVKGAGGGPGVDNRGRSLGASLRATFDWEEGDFIYILVGQKGIDPCRTLKRSCDMRIMKRSIDRLRALNKEWDEGGGGGGGGATYVFKIDPLNDQRIPLAIAGGGGGLSARRPKDDSFLSVMPHGLMPNNSILPINGYTGSGAGGGGGWDDNTNTVTGGESLREGGRGGRACQRSDVWHTDGGFGGGGGGCASGGGGGGYRGGDASEVESPYHNGQGGTSYLMPGTIRALVEPGSNPEDGSVIIIPAQSGCGCDYLCVHLDLDNSAYYCICPPHLTINIDGYSCNGHTGMSVSPKMLVVIILSIVIAVSLGTVCIFFATARYRKIQRSRDVSNQPLNSPDEQLSRLRSGVVAGGMISENNPNYEFGGNSFREQDLKALPRENLTLVHPLGQGAFGEVYQGTLKMDDAELPVAVKTLPEMSSNQAVLDFLMEAVIMSKFNHPNIVSFIGVCFDKMPRFIVLELLPGGDLKMFLRECRPKPNKPSPLTLTDLLKLAIDVAKGCQYLEENHFIHRDIAARNCLLTTKDADRVVKIADFGMARDIYRADYYRKGGKAMLPVKWMPPEAFLDGIFTSKTDVWSYGVLLWEVISLGYMPYPGRGNQEVMQLVTSGGRLEPPTNCPAPVYHIMMQCWHPHPDERPNFTTIIERLGYCMQDPDVINAALPVFQRAPSMERDTTVMRPGEEDGAGCLQFEHGAHVQPEQDLHGTVSGDGRQGQHSLDEADHSLRDQLHDPRYSDGASMGDLRREDP